MTNVPHWILRRFASRSIAIVERLDVAQEAALALYLKTVAVSAPAYLAAFQAVLAYELARTHKLRGRGAKFLPLLRKMRTWAAALAKDLGLDASRYGDRATVPEEIVNDTIELLAVLARHEAEGGEMPFYTEELRTDLNASLAAAQLELSAAGGSEVTLADLRNTLKQAAQTFQADLVVFRRGLRAFFGSSHPDYQRLRMPRNFRDMTTDEADPKDDAVPSPQPPLVDQELVEVDDEEEGEETLAQAG